MYIPSKIATCTYCGTRAALTLRGKERHELACSTCGAPLHDLKMLKSQASVRSEPKHRAASEPRSYKKSKKKKKRGKSLGQRFLGEVWDVAEDIFDVFD